MSRKDQRNIVRHQRELLVDELNVTYGKAFDRLASLDLPDRTLARLTQLILNSRESAMTLLKQEIEAPRITRAPLV